MFIPQNESMPPRIIDHVTHVLSYQPLAPMLNITLSKPNINIEIFNVMFFHQKTHLCPLVDVINSMENPMNVYKFQWHIQILDNYTLINLLLIFACLKKLKIG
jgi:hypothetical protein